MYYAWLNNFVYRVTLSKSPIVTSAISNEMASCEPLTSSTELDSTVTVAGIELLGTRVVAGVVLAEGEALAVCDRLKERVPSVTYKHWQKCNHFQKLVAYNLL